MDDLERRERAMLEFSAARFENEIRFTKDRPWYPEPGVNGKPLNPEQRQWGQWCFTGFTLVKDPRLTRVSWMAQLSANRSDGQNFLVYISEPLGFSKDTQGEDPLLLIDRHITEAVEKLNSMRDCACGIIGYTERTDEDGELILDSINSPCELHPS